jgi:hypothetical protein
MRGSLLYLHLASATIMAWRFAAVPHTHLLKPYTPAQTIHTCSTVLLIRQFVMMQARSLVMVFKEPGNVALPLAVAAGFPADALGRIAVTTGAIADALRRIGVTPTPWASRSPDEEQAMWAALGGLLPQPDRPLADIAEVDGAAAMWAAVPGHVSDWLQLQADVRADD